MSHAHRPEQAKRSRYGRDEVERPHRPSHWDDENEEFRDDWDGAQPRPPRSRPPDGNGSRRDASPRDRHGTRPRHDERRHDERRHDERRHDERRHDERRHDERRHDERRHDERFDGRTQRRSHSLWPDDDRAPGPSGPSARRERRNSRAQWEDDRVERADGRDEWRRAARGGLPPARRAYHAVRETIDRWGETSREWVVGHVGRLFSEEFPAARRGQELGSSDDGVKRKRARVTAPMVVAILLACVLPTLCTAGQSIHAALLANSGIQHLKSVQADLKTLGSHPFDLPTIVATENDLASAHSDFSQLQGVVQWSPGVGFLPRIGSATKLVPLVADGTQAGVLGCQVLAILAPKLKNPLDTQGQGLTEQDIASITQRVNQIQVLAKRMLDVVSTMQPSDFDLDPRLAALKGLRDQVPQMRQLVQGLSGVLAALPALLGIDQPTNYLMEVLDSTELRPGGGFIGNYGLLTLNAGHLSGIHIEDVELLDYNVIWGPQVIPVPTQYAWFNHLYPKWGFRDSNLDADFPTSARNGEQLYQQESGKNPVPAAVPIQGVVAITPWLIQDALKLTGPIAVPEYSETVTADNLVDRIHAHQLGVGHAPGDIVDPTSGTSRRKRFTAFLFEHFLDKVKQLSATDMSSFLHLFTDGLHTKDVQIYLNDSAAEDMLTQLHIASTVDASPTGDSLFVVDANIGANKANYFLQYNLSDQVTIDPSGAAVHHTTITYLWPKDPATITQNYGQVKDSYHSYQRIYVPPHATLGKRQGYIGTDDGTSKTFNRSAWAGDYRVLYGSTTTLTLDWTAPNAVTQDASGYHYHYLMQKQAGVTFTVNLQVALPQCAKLTGSSPSGLFSGTAQRLTAKEPFTTDLNLAFDYTC